MAAGDLHLTFLWPTDTTSPRVRDLGVYRHEARPLQAVARMTGPSLVGRTLVRKDGVYTFYDNPRQAILDAADKVWLGGREYDDPELEAYLDG